MTWKEYLIKQAGEIVQHGQGELRLTVVRRSGKVSVRIQAGKSDDFLVEPVEDLDDD